MNYSEMPLNSIKPAPWRVNYVLKPDMLLLAESMNDYGWLQPIVVQKSTSYIIDGFHRWVTAQDSNFVKKYGKTVPVIIVDVDNVDAMIMHVRLNRARGNIFAKPFSKLIRTLVVSDKYSADEIADMLNMSADEFDLMLTGGLLKQRKIPQHQYSKAWVPVEAPSKGELDNQVIERPPNADR
jgi:ParB-like chromosome segregation protein Spo0J